jgi:hypothetical protein
MCPIGSSSAAVSALRLARHVRQGMRGRMGVRLPDRKR